MKRLILMFAFMSLFLMPTTGMAASEKGYAVVTLPGEEELLFGAYVCKLDSCDPDNPTDWFNYGATFDGGDNSGGQELIVKPGDTITFLGATRYNGVSESFTPELTIGFVGMEYLEDMEIFNGSNDNLDGDEIGYTWYDDTISFDDPLNNNTQTGYITAKIAAGTPNGAVIEGILAFDDTQIGPQGAFERILGEKAEAEVVAGTVARVVVNNQAVAEAPAETLPDTGADNHRSNAWPYASVIGAFVLMGVWLERRKKEVK